MAPAGLAVVAFLSLAASPGLGYAIVCVTVAASWALNHPPPAGTDVAARLVLATAVLWHAVGGGRSGWVMGSAAVLLGLLLVEGTVHRLVRPWYRAAHLPVRPGAPAAAVDNGLAWAVNSAAVVLVGLVALLGLPGWSLLAPPAAAAVFAAWLLVDGARRWRTAHRAELAPLAERVRRHGPRFLIYFSAPAGSEYQVRMWLPYLERLGEPFLVVLAERHNLAPLAGSTSAPVVVCDTFEALDAIMVPSLRAAFYVNNGMKNAHCVRFARFTHVQLYHGDSDKVVTASPLNVLYDRIFVAGQAAIDRFADHGVRIPPEKFRIVGRPQVEALEVVRDRPPLPGTGARPSTVLYAPTWVGAYADSDYCSLPVAETIIQGLLECGATVIMRPHPYTSRDRASVGHLRRAEQLLARDRDRTGREHQFGRAATTASSLFECMNLADAMICDVSSVASDFLYTGKPFALTDMVGVGGRFPRTFPVARAAYVIDRYGGNVAGVLTDLLGGDPLRRTRWDIRTSYLGDFPPGRYADAFLAEARRCVAGDQVGRAV
jgi:hypothetical protein